MNSADFLFKGRHFDRLVIVLFLRWYVVYKLSYRDLVAMMAERGLSMAHITMCPATVTTSIMWSSAATVSSPSKLSRAVSPLRTMARGSGRWNTRAENSFPALSQYQ